MLRLCLGLELSAACRRCPSCARHVAPIGALAVLDRDREGQEVIGYGGAAQDFADLPNA